MSCRELNVRNPMVLLATAFLLFACGGSSESGSGSQNDGTASSLSLTGGDEDGRAGTGATAADASGNADGVTEATDAGGTEDDAVDDGPLLSDVVQTSPEPSPELIADCESLCAPLTDCELLTPEMCLSRCTSAGVDGCDYECLTLSDNCAAAEYCFDIQEATATFAEGPYGIGNRDLAAPFTLPTTQGPWSFEAAFNGIDNYLFISSSTGWEYSGLLWQSSVHTWLTTGASNVQIFILSYDDDPTELVNSIQSKIEATLATLHPVSACRWRRRIHYVTVPRDQWGWIGQKFETFLGLAFSIDRSQTIRQVGYVVNPSTQSVQLSFLNYEVLYYNFEHARQAALEAETRTEVVAIEKTELQGGNVDVQFPTALEMAEFDTLQIELVAHCVDNDDANCGEWDTTASLSVCAEPVEATNPYANTACQPAIPVEELDPAATDCSDVCPAACEQKATCDGYVATLASVEEVMGACSDDGAACVDDNGCVNTVPTCDDYLAAAEAEAEVMGTCAADGAVCTADGECAASPIPCEGFVAAVEGSDEVMGICTGDEAPCSDATTCVDTSPTCDGYVAAVAAVQGVCSQDASQCLEDSECSGDAICEGATAASEEALGSCSEDGQACVDASSCADSAPTCDGYVAAVAGVPATTGSCAGSDTECATDDECTPETGACEGYVAASDAVEEVMGTCSEDQAACQQASECTDTAATCDGHVAAIFGVAETMGVCSNDGATGCATSDDCAEICAACDACKGAIPDGAADIMVCECANPDGTVTESTHTCLEDGSGYGTCACGCGFETARWITTYGREGRWITDSSQFLPYYQKGGNIRVGYSGGNTYVVDLIFHLSNRAKGMRPTELFYLYSGGSFNETYNDNYEPKTVQIPATATKVELVTLITGHGWGIEKENCAEFCLHTHHFTINGSEFVRKHDQHYAPGNGVGCAAHVSEGVVPNQYGTWPYGRAGWCPGLDVKPWVADVTAVVTPGEEATINYQGLFKGASYVPEDNPNGNSNGFHAQIAMNSWLVIHTE